MEVPKPVVKLLYNKQDLSKPINKYLVELAYLDRTEVESDEIEIVLDDSEGIWSNSWYPEKGAKLVLDIGYVGQMTPAGEFEIDEVTFNYSARGRKVSIKALSAIVSQPLRTPRKEAYENITLKKLADTVAARAHLTVSGKIANVNLGRITQFNETDLAFLRRIATSYGYIFNVKSGKLVFTFIGELEGRKSVDTIDPTRMRSVDIYDATGRTYRIAKQTYYDASKGQVIQYDAKGKSGADTFADESYVENKQQAELKAKARIAKILTGQVRGSVSMQQGAPLLVAGNNIEIVRIGKFSGLYNIEASRHIISKSGGYTTDIEVYKVADVSKDKY